MDERELRCTALLVSEGAVKRAKLGLSIWVLTAESQAGNVVGFSWSSPWKLGQRWFSFSSRGVLVWRAS